MTKQDITTGSFLKELCNDPEIMELVRQQIEWTNRPSSFLAALKKPKRLMKRKKKKK